MALNIMCFMILVHFVSSFFYNFVAINIGYFLLQTGKMIFEEIFIVFMTTFSFEDVLKKSILSDLAYFWGHFEAVFVPNV